MCLLVCVSNCVFFMFKCYFLTLVDKFQTGLVDQMTSGLSPILCDKTIIVVYIDQFFRI